MDVCKQIIDRRGSCGWQAFKSLPEVKKVQRRHCFQNGKLVNQQLEDHNDPVNASVDFEHVALITNLEKQHEFSILFSIYLFVYLSSSRVISPTKLLQLLLSFKPTIQAGYFILTQSVDGDNSVKSWLNVSRPSRKFVFPQLLPLASQKHIFFALIYRGKLELLNN